MKPFWALFAIAMSLTGCGRSRTTAESPAAPLFAHDLVIHDSTGTVVATGSIDLPVQVPPIGFDGRWQLKSAAASFPSTATRNGKYSCRPYGSELSIDLNPGIVDHNVSLFGVVTNGSWNGKWYYETQAGGKESGKFTATRPSSGRP